MRIHRVVAILAIAFAPSLAAQERSEDVIFAAALEGVRHQLEGAPPLNLQHPRDGRELPAGAIASAA